MRNRLLGALVLLPLFTGLLTGGPILYLTSFMLTVLGLREFYSSFKEREIKPIFSIGVILSIYILLKNIFDFQQNISILVLFTIFLLTVLLAISKKANIIDIAITYFGFIYIMIPFESIIATYESGSYGFTLVILIFVISFSTDIFAYLIGKKFGKNKLIPSVSPNKTIEGSVGAIIATVIITKIYCTTMGLHSNMFICVAILGSIFAQLGDLFASSIKRQNGLKDFGHLIPGHGGIIDRFDSILLTSLFILCLTL